MQTFKIPYFLQFQSPGNQFLFSELFRPLVHCNFNCSFKARRKVKFWTGVFFYHNHSIIVLTIQVKIHNLLEVSSLATINDFQYGFNTGREMEPSIYCSLTFPNPAIYIVVVTPGSTKAANTADDVKKIIKKKKFEISVEMRKLTWKTNVVVYWVSSRLFVKKSNILIALQVSCFALSF